MVVPSTESAPVKVVEPAPIVRALSAKVSVASVVPLVSNVQAKEAAVPSPQVREESSVALKARSRL
jgi:hypothetical protein